MKCHLKLHIDITLHYITLCTATCTAAANGHAARYLDVNGAGDDAVDRGLGERIELSVFATHEVRLEDVAAAAVVLERPEVQLHRQVCTPPHQHSRSQFSANPPYPSISFFSFRFHYMDFPDCLGGLLYF